MIIKKTYYAITYVTLLLMSVPAYSQTTDTPIMQSQINTPNGVAGLDSKGNITASVKTDKNISTTSHLDIGTLISKPRATFFQNYNDIGSSPHTIHLGGLEKASDAYVNIIGMTMGQGDASGAVLSVQDSGDSFYGNRNGAGLTDAIVEFTKTNNNPPRLKAGPEILNADNNTKGRTVTITQNGFSVSPAFSEEQMKTICDSGRIRVYTNWKNGNIESDDTKKGLHGLDRPNVYFGYIDPNETTITGNDQFFKIYSNPVDYTQGWRTENNSNSAANPPGQNEGDSIDNINDTNATISNYIWSYSTPSVFIGMSDKKFLHNDMAQFISPKKNTYRKDSISRAMTGVEYDLIADQDHDYQYKIDGIMVGADGNGYKLTSDSTDMFLGGNINHHLIIGETCENYAIESNGFMVPGKCYTKTANAGYVMGKFKGQSYSGETIAISMNNLTKNNPEYGWGNNVPAIMATINTIPNEYSASLKDDQNPFKSTVGLAGIKWKQDDDNGSISLCGGSFAKNCGLTVTNEGDIKITGNFVNPLLLAAVNYHKDTQKVSGQGTAMMWNTITPGGAGTELINVDPTGGNGGFDFFNINTGNTVPDKNPLLRLKNDGAYFNVSPIVNDNKLISFKSSNNRFAVYLALAGTYTDEDKKAGKKDTRGDLYVGTNVGGGANIRGVNGYYGQNATISGTIKANSIVTEEFMVNNNLAVGKGKSVLFYTTKGEIGAYTFSDDTGNLIVQSNSKGGGISASSYTLANLPTPSHDHVMLWCSDCKINGIAGAPVWWHANISRWTDSQNNTLSN